MIHQIKFDVVWAGLLHKPLLGCLLHQELVRLVLLWRWGAHDLQAVNRAVVYLQLQLLLSFHQLGRAGGSTFPWLKTYLLHVLLHELRRHVLRQRVRWIARAQHLPV